MKPAFAHLAPTVPVAFAAAMGIALSIFLLPGAGVQGEPTPLLAVIGGAAGRVAADLPVPVKQHVSKPVRKAVTPARPVVTRSEASAPLRRPAAARTHGARTHRTQRHTRARVAQPAPSGPVQAAAPSTSATPVATRRPFGNPSSARSRSRGHGLARGLKPAPGTQAPHARGHGKAKALGHSSEHHGGLPPGQAKKAKAPTTQPPAPASPAKSHGGGNGHERSGK